jgi:hypothetical protein
MSKNTNVTIGNEQKILQFNMKNMNNPREFVKEYEQFKM